MKEVDSIGSFSESDKYNSGLNFNNWDIDRYSCIKEVCDVRLFEDAYLIRTDRGWIAFDSQLEVIESSCVSRFGICSDQLIFTPLKINNKNFVGQAIVEKLDLNKENIKKLASAAFEKDSLIFLGNLHKQFGHQITEGLRFSHCLLDDHDLHHIDFLMNGLEKYPKIKWMISSLGYDVERRHFIPENRQTIIRVNRLYVPEPGMSLFGVYHKPMKDVYNKIYEKSIEECSISDFSPYKKVFLDRASKKRPCKDILAIKKSLMKKGFLIIKSESYPLVEEIAIIGGADYVFGLAGSDMHMTQFNQGGKIGLISHNRFVAPDYYSTSRINDNDIVFVLGNIDEDYVDKLDAGFSLFDDSFKVSDFEKFLDEFVDS